VAPRAQPHLTADDLDVLLRWLRPRFAFLTPEEFMAGSAPGILLTFDDGFANNFGNALPVLRAHGAPALFFVSTQHVIDPHDWLGFVRDQVRGSWGSIESVPPAIAADWYDGLSLDEIRACAADPLLTIGSHGVTHAVLTECTTERVASVLADSKRYLEEASGQPVEYFAYPKGLYDAGAVRLVEAAGYRAAFTIDPLGGRPTRLFELPRVGIYQADRRYLSLKLSGLHRRPLPVGIDRRGS